MVYRKFRVAVSLRLALLFVWVGLFFYFLIRTELTAGAVILGLLIVAQIWGIFRTIDRTNRDLARFFDSVRFGDFSQTFREKSQGGVKLGE